MINGQEKKNALDKGYLAAVTVIILIGAAFRFFRLDFQSFWFDEAASVDFARRELTGDFISIIAGDVYPPLYYLLLHFWLKWIGSSDWAIRAFSAVCSTLALPFFLLLARKLVSPAAAVFALLIFSVSSFQIWYAQEARAYSLVVLLTVFALLAYIALLERRCLRNVFILAFMAALLCYTHYLAALSLAACLLNSAVSDVRDRPSFTGSATVLTAGAFFLAFLLFTPWLPVFLEQYGRVANGFWIAPASLIDIGLAFAKFEFYETNIRMPWIWKSFIIGLIASGAFLRHLIGCPGLAHRSSRASPSSFLRLSRLLPHGFFRRLGRI